MSEEQLLANRRDQNIDNAEHKYMDEDYYASKDFDYKKIQVPVLSVANWGGISLHLRGNVVSINVNDIDSVYFDMIA